MNAAELAILLAEGEGTTLEYKEGLSASFARELVALANTVGGRILLGVRDDRTVAGIEDSNELRARIQDIARNCDPPVRVQVQRMGEVIVVTVRESDAKPVQCSDGFFWRQGSTTQKLRREEIRDIFRMEGQIRFDLSLCPGFRYPQDFDRAKYLAWLRLSGITGRPRTEDVLVNIEAAERSGGRLLFRNAGVLFFAKNVRRFFNQAYVTCLLAKGTDKVRVLDRKDFDGGIVADIEDTMRFIERNTRTAWRIEALQRENIPEYPMKALREAVTNAVMHRDWFIEGANVFVELYTDRIEVSSPGGLPKGMRLSDLGHKSLRRNALIADLLHRIEFIEKAGTGIRRIREDAREQGCPAPAFEASGFFTATFHPNPEVRALATEQGQVASGGAQVGAQEVQVEDQEVQVEDQEVQVEVQEVQVEVQEAQDVLTSMEWTLLASCRSRLRSSQELVSILGYRRRTGNFRQSLGRLLVAGLIEPSLPDKPRSPKQRYRISDRGLRLLTRRERP